MRLPPQRTSLAPGLLATAARIAPAVLPHDASTPTEAAEPMQPASPTELYELAVTVCAMGFHGFALDPLREVTENAPDHAGAWRKLAEVLRLAGNDAEAAAARAIADRIGDNQGKWPKAKGERSPTKIEKAERRLRAAMARVPPEEQIAELRKYVFCDALDVVSMRYLALQEIREDDPISALTLLERVLDLSPDYHAARSDYAHLLLEQRFYTLAGVQARRLLARRPRDFAFRGILVRSLAETSRFAEAIEVVEGMIRDQPNNAQYYVPYGNNLHVVGRHHDSAAAYRKALAIAPALAEAYSGLVALKGNFLTDQDVDAMRIHLASGRLNEFNTWHMSYALAQALERRRDFAGSFVALEHGARAFGEHIAGTRYASDPAAADERVRHLKQVFSAETFAARAAPRRATPPRDTPIFIVGMPRAGSTLLEQILASHSMVEGTRELLEMNYITRDLSLSRRLVTTMTYPDQVLGLTPDDLASLGDRYIRETAIYRRSDRPYFVDKRPWNWMDAGLIHLILPHAKIIDIRRAPIAACFAMYKQLLPPDAAFSYDLNHVGRFYNGYVNMMEHYEAVLPGRIHYLSYERLIENTETEVRRLLDYCGLPFEDGCLRFWETDRAVVTPSLEQVRTPIFRDALEHWRNFEPWLDPLKASLAEGFIGGRAAHPIADRQTTPQGATLPPFTLPSVPNQLPSTPAAPARPAPAVPPAELYERALTSCAMGFPDNGLNALRGVVDAAPDHAGAWRALAELLRLSGKDEEAAAARAAADRLGDVSAKWPKATGERSPTKIEKAGRRLGDEMARVTPENLMAELRNRVIRDPLDVVTMRYLALQEWRAEDLATAETLLRRVLDLSPGYFAARANYAGLLQDRRNYILAAEEARRLLAHKPRDLDFRGILAFALAKTSRFAEAIEVLEGMIRDQPNTARFWVSYGNNLHVVGRNEDSAAAYRKALAIAPATADAYLGLAALKGAFLTDEDVAAMRVRLASGALSHADRWELSYALAQALERRRDYAGCFAALENGARAFRENYAGTRDAYNPEIMAERLRRLKQVFTAENLAARARPVEDTPPRDTPIFVVGMPRAGSTLLEQILASHSMVEGTRELPVMGDIISELAQSRRLITDMAYPECVLDLAPDQLVALGERYLHDAGIYRHSGRPYFIDKRPWNWMDAGLIHLILPHAKIIDIRRQPMAACFAMFKQLLPLDAAFSYDLGQLGRYYNGYADMMRHYETALPGRIHYVSYERLVEDTETEVRRLLDYCGLKFEEGCLRFWETDRAVVTPSAEQVRTPMFRDALEHWRHFEPWLGPLKAALEGS